MPKAAEDDVLDTEPVVEVEQQTTEVEGNPPEDEQAEVEQQAETDPDEVIVSIGEPPKEDDDLGTDTPVLRAVRKENRQLVSRVRELEGKLKAAPPKDEPADDLGPKPKMADEGINFDEDVFEQRLTEWNAKRATQESRKQARQEADNKAQEAYQTKLGAYKTAAAGLKVPDFEDAEAQARDAFSPIQQSILVKHAAAPAALIYALGKNPAEAKKLAAIADPIEFALAARKLEELVKVTPKRVAPPPERVIRGSGPVSATSEKKLEQLRAEAAKTGDSTKVVAYKRQLKQAKQ
jgi:hypothetical protein